MSLLGRAWNVIADWVCQPMNDPTYWKLDEDRRNVHHYTKLARLLDERGWRDTE